MSDDPDVRISTDVEADSLLWIFGIEEIRTSSFIRSGGFPPNSAIPCTLITYRKPNRLCKPNDDGRDTLIKWFSTSRPNFKTNLLGTYRGFIIEKPLEGTFDVVITDTLQTPTYAHTYLENFPERGMTSNIQGWVNSLFTDIKPNAALLEYRYFSFQTPDVTYYNTYPESKGFASIHPKDPDSITIEMEYRRISTQPLKKVTFVGKRIN